MIIFKNKGLIDLRAIRTIGLNAKPNTTNPMGEFGTGLKLAVSVILRNEGAITLYRGRKRYELGTVNTKFRGEKCALVTLNGEELGFTLNYGKNWKPWQAFRELYSNMLDEDEGTCHYTSGPAQPEPGYTTIVVDGCGFDELFENKRNVFLEGDPLLKVPGLEVHFGQTGVIYYNGMRAMDLPKPSLFTYNITSYMTLTEDRTFMFSHAASARVMKALVQSNDGEILINILGADDDNWESGFDYDLDSSDKVSGTFMRVAADMKARRQKMSSGASKLFTEKALSTSTYGMSRLRQPTDVEAARCHKALEMIRMKLPNIGDLPCQISLSGDVDYVHASSDCIEIPIHFSDWDILTLASKIITALCTRNSKSGESSAAAVARMFLLGSFEDVHLRENISEGESDDLPFIALDRMAS